MEAQKTPTYREAFKELRAALKATAVYATIGVGAGLLWIGAAYLLEKYGFPFVTPNINHALAVVSEHLGVGLIVAGFAVVLYEWGGHFRAGLKLSEELDGLRAAVGREALERSLRELVSGRDAEHDQKFRVALTGFVERLGELQAHGDWTSEGFARYLCELLENATENAQKLSRISTRLQREPGAAIEKIKVFSSSALTDSMLAAQMSRLHHGGKYTVVSNIGSWLENRLQRLQVASEAAVAEGVTIYRLFVLAHRGPHRESASAQQVRGVLERHYKAAVEWKGAGSYQVRVLDEISIRNLSRTNSEVRVAVEKISLEHFGIFEKLGEKHAVRVEVTEADLSALRIEGGTPDPALVAHFQQVWNASEMMTLSPRVIEDVVSRWKPNKS